MRISCSTAWAGVWPLDEAVAAIARAGFDAIDLVTPANTPVDDLRGLLRAGSLEVSGLAVSEPVDEVNMREAATLARGLGLPSFAVWTALRNEQSMAQLADAVRRMLDHPDDVGLELVNRNESRLEQPTDFHELCILVDHPRLRVRIDTLEFHRACVDPRAALRQLADRCTCIMLADARGNRQAPLGQGEMNVSALLDAARRSGEVERLVLSPVIASRHTAVADLIAERERLECLLGQC